MLGGRGPTGRCATWVRRRLLVSRWWHARYRPLGAIRCEPSGRNGSVLLAAGGGASLVGALGAAPAVAADQGTWRGTVTTTAHYVFDHPEGTVHREGDANSSFGLDG